MNLLDGPRPPSISPSLPPAGGPLQRRERDTVVRQGLGLGVLRLGQEQLGVGQLEDGADPGVEPALGQAEVLLGEATAVWAAAMRSCASFTSS